MTWDTVRSLFSAFVFPFHDSRKTALRSRFRSLFIIMVQEVTTVSYQIKQYTFVSMLTYSYNP